MSNQFILVEFLLKEIETEIFQITVKTQSQKPFIDQLWGMLSD